MVHSLVKYEYQSTSYPAYRHYVECTCGFQSRQSTEAAVKGQFDSHLRYHGEQPYFATLVAKEDLAPVPAEPPAPEVFNPFAQK